MTTVAFDGKRKQALDLAEQTQLPQSLQITKCL